MTRRSELSATSWQAYLPAPAPSSGSTANQSRLLEIPPRLQPSRGLVIRDAEIFRYRVVGHTTDDFYERLVITEEETSDESRPSWSRIQGGLTQHLTTELASNKPDCDKVVLTVHRDLRVGVTDKSARWTVDAVDGPARTVSLARPLVESDAPADDGYIRTWGMAIGQVPLISRRLESIERAVDHTYLLQALTAPGFVYMDTGEVDLDVRLPESKVDPPKRAVIEDVLPRTTHLCAPRAARHGQDHDGCMATEGDLWRTIQSPKFSSRRRRTALLTFFATGSLRSSRI